MSETGSYFCTDNICISNEHKDFERIDAALDKETFSIWYGFKENNFSIYLLLSLFAKKNAFFFLRALTELNRYLIVYLADTTIIA